MNPINNFSRHPPLNEEKNYIYQIQILLFGQNEKSRSNRGINIKCENAQCLVFTNGIMIDAFLYPELFIK